MKKINCYDCDKEFIGQTPEEVLNQMYPHYMEDHKEIITGASEEEKKKWMENFNKNWHDTEGV